MCTGLSCKAKVNIRYSVAVAVLGLLLFANGVSLVVIGAIWDSITSGSSQLYIVKEKIGSYTYYNGGGENSILMYEGLLICIPTIPAILQLCKRVRSTTILFLLSLLIGLSGSVVAAIFSGISWTGMQVVYQSYKGGFCDRDDTQCNCKLPTGYENEKTATMFFSDCHKIETLHNLINVYFALSIVSCLLTTIGVYLGCVGCCNPEEDPKETTRLANSGPPCYSSVEYNPAAQQNFGFNGAGMAPHHAYAPTAPGGAMASGPPNTNTRGKAPVYPQQAGPQSWVKEGEGPLISF